MRNVKKVVIIFGLIFLSVAVFYFMKQPSYTIKTEGKLYVVNKLSSNVTVFDLFEGELIKDIPIEQEPHEATVLNNPNRVIITNYGSPEVEGKSLTVINADNNSIEKTIDLGRSLKPHGIISLSDPKKVAVVADIGNDLSVVNIETGIVEKQISTQQEVSHLLARHPFKPLVYISNINSGSVSVIDVDQNKVVKIIPCSERAEGIDISPDGSEIWVTNIKDNFISVINTESYQITNRIDTGNEPLRLKFSNDGMNCLVSNSGEGTISVYNAKTKKTVARITIPGKKNIVEKLIYRTPRPVGILMHPNGMYAFVSNMTAGRVEVIDMSDFTLVSSIKVGKMPDGLALIN